MNLKTVLVVASFAVAISFAIYSPSLHGPFVFDGENIENGSRLHITSFRELDRIVFAEGLPRRVGLASFALNFYFDELQPFGYHVTNVLIHAANGVLVFWFSFRLLALVGAASPRARFAAVLAATLWLIHPVQTQAVAYIYQRFTSLCTLFFLLSLCTYLEADRGGTLRRVALYLVSIVSALLALGTKEIAATLPLMIALIEIVVRPRGSFQWSVRSTLALLVAVGSFAIACAVYLGPNFVAMMTNQYEHRGFTLTERLLTESRVVVHYLGLILWPHPSRLMLDYDVSLSTSLIDPLSTVLSMGVIALLLATAIGSVRRYPLYAFAIVWFFGNIAVESTIVPLELAYEHRVYLPSTGLFVWLSYAMTGVLGSRARTFVLGVAGLSILTWSYWTYERNLVWADPVALWEDNARKAPGKARVHANLGKAYHARREDGAAEQSFRRALAIDPTMTGAYVSLANLYLEQGRLDEATGQIEAARELEPGYVPAQLAMGLVQLRRGDFRRAIGVFEDVLEVDESNHAALFNLATAHFNLGDYDRAITVLQRGTYYWPANATLHALLGAAFVERGNVELGRESLVRALSLRPENGLATRYLERIER